MKDSRLCLQEIESTSSNMKRHNSWWKRRTFMEKKFCILIVFLLAVCVGMGVTAVWYYFTYIIPQLAMIKNAKTITTSTTTLTTTPETMTTKTELPPPNLCLTPGCVRAANRILESMNQKINPCDDFYEFVCGGFLQKTHIPDEKTSMSQFSRLHEDLTHQIKNLMEAEEKQDDFEIDRMVKDFYASCMNLTRISELGLAPLDKIIKEVGGWPVLMGIKWDATNLDWKTLMYRFSEVDFSTNFFVGLGIIRDFKNNSKHIFALVEPSTGFPYSYLKKGKNDSNVLDHLQFMVETAVFWGANREVAEKEMEDVLDFELKLLQILKDPNQKSKNISKIYNESTIAELYEMNADMNWSEYIKKLYPYDMDETEPIVVTLGQNFTSNFTKLYADTNIRILANYAIGRMVRSLTPFVSEEYGELHFEIFKKMSGIQQRPTRWKRCMAQTKSYFSTAIGSMYVDKFFKPEAKTMAIEMVDMIRAEMKDIINKVSWADPKTIKRAKEKLDAVVAHVAYPEELLDEEEMLGVYENYTISRLDFFDNVRSISRLDTTEYKQRLREPVKRNHWEKKSNVAVVNAFYNSLDNSISIPAGILQDVFFDFDRPQYMNFAAIGTVVGHELTHGFDNTGRQFDKDGHLLNWWEADTNERFIDRSQCMIDQYGNYTVPETGENLNGRNTLGENIADNGGLKESYYAYRTWAQHHEEEKLLPGVNYTINQLFWISYATIWCIKQRPEQAHLQIEFGVHSLGRFRVNGPLSNMQAFAEDFHCPLGSPLNPVSKLLVYWLHITTISLGFLTCFGASFHNGHYKIIVRIDNSILQDNQTEIINYLKLLFTQASEFLHIATNQLTSYEEIIIILPSSWKKTSVQLWNSIEKSDVLLTNKSEFYPYTQQSQGCGYPGDITYIPVSYINVPLKESAILLLENWIRLRYGTFEEHGWEYDSMYPNIYWENGQMKLSQCITDFTTNETPLPGYTTDEIHLCDNKTHNYNAPTRQNLLCSYRSVWDVMMEHNDFKSGLSPHPFLQPKINIVKQAQMHLVFIIDASHHYHSVMMHFQQAMAFLMLNEVPNKTFVTLIEHKEGNAELLLKLIEITDMQSRGDFLYALPHEPNGQPNLQAALNIADNVYKNNSEYQTVFFIPIFGNLDGASQINNFQNVEIFFFFTNPFRITTYPKYNSDNINNIMLPEPRDIGKALNHALNKILHLHYPNNQHVATVINELHLKKQTHYFYIDDYTDELITTVVSTVLDSIQEVVITPPTHSPILLSHSELCTQDMARRIATCRITEPQSGLWRFSIISDDSLQDIVVDISVKCTTCLFVQSWLSKNHVKTITRNMPLIFAQVNSQIKHINASVIAQVKHAPTGKINTVELFDNGRDPDIRRKDGIYTAILSPLLDAGWYYIKVSINASNDNSSNYKYLQRQVITGSIYLNDRISDNSPMRHPTTILDLHIDVSSTEQDVLLLSWTNNINDFPATYDIRWSEGIDQLLNEFGAVANQLLLSEQEIDKIGSKRQVQLPLANLKSSFCFALKLLNSYKIAGKMSNIVCMSQVKPMSSLTPSKKPIQWSEPNPEEITTPFLAMAIALGVCVFSILIICIAVTGLLNQYKLVRKRGNVNVEETTILKNRKDEYVNDSKV